MRLLPFEYAARNLGRSRTRLALTLLGSGLVVLLIVTAAGFVRGMALSLQASGGEHNVIIVGAGSEESAERSEVAAAVPGLLAAAVPGVRSAAGVAFVSPEVHVMLPVGEPRVGGRARQVMLRGVTPAAALVHEQVRLLEGRWPEAGRDEVMVGRAVPSVLSLRPETLALGESLVLDGRPWRIVGRFSAPGTVVEAEVWLPLSDLMAATKRETISCILLTLDPYDEETGTGAEFADIDLFAKSRPDLELFALPEREYYARLSGIYRPIRIVTWVTAGLIALGGLFGGLNTMYAAFASRIRELGALQAIGFRRASIFISMVQEATLATAAGGLPACAIGVFLLDGAAVRFSMGAFGLAVDESVAALGLVCGLLLGVLGAGPPAIRCLSPSIPEALKSA